MTPPAHIDVPIDRVLVHLERLVDLAGAPGHEQAVADYVLTSLDPFAAASVDTHGSVIVEMVGPAPGPVLLLAAHTDEVALVVKNIDASGFLQVGVLGSVIREVAAGRMVRVAGHPGIVGVRPGHFWRTGSDLAQAPDRLYVDVGASSAAAVRAAGIDIGTPVTFWNPLQRFGIDRDLVVGKALDDRLGCAVLLTLLERETPPAGRLVAAFTVQEEVGLRGAGAVAHRIAPDFALAIDTIACADTPDGDPSHDVPLRLGAGPALPLATGPRGTGLLVSSKVATLLRAIGAEAGVELQTVVFGGGDNDATTMAWAGVGCHAGSIAIARRYAHTPVEVADFDDVRATYTWLQALIVRMTSWPDGLRRSH